jgi:hypothetical protein
MLYSGLIGGIFGGGHFGLGRGMQPPSFPVTPPAIPPNSSSLNSPRPAAGVFPLDGDGFDSFFVDLVPMV